MGENKRYNIGLWLAEPWKKRPTVCVMLTEKVSNSPFYLFLHTPIFSCQWLWVNVIIKNFNIKNCIITDSYKKKKKKKNNFPSGESNPGPSAYKAACVTTRPRSQLRFTVKNSLYRVITGTGWTGEVFLLVWVWPQIRPHGASTAGIWRQ